MAYKITETELAAQDLERIVGHISKILSNRTAASAFLDAVEQCYDKLERMPEMYELCRDPHLRELGYRKAVIKHYIMVYKIDEMNQQVFILRFFYGRQDYEKLI